MVDRKVKRLSADDKTHMPLSKTMRDKSARPLGAEPPRSFRTGEAQPRDTRRASSHGHRALIYDPAFESFIRASCEPGVCDGCSIWVDFYHYDKRNCE